MRRRTVGLLLGAVIALGIGMVAFRRADPPTAAPGVESPAGAKGSVEDAATTPADPARRASASMDAGIPATASTTNGAAAANASPLPPADAPLATILDELEHRARAGDARAACRLAAEIGRCAALPRRLASVNPAPQVTVPPGNNPADARQIERYIDFAARQQIELERDQALCAGVPRERLRDASPWLLASARGGNPTAIAVFASGLWTLTDPYALRHAEVLAAYSREAERMAMSLVEAGSPEMLRPLAMAYAGEDPNVAIDGLVEPDPVRGHALLRLYLGPHRSGAPAQQVGSDGKPAPVRPEQRAFEQLDARLDVAQRAASDALFARLSARRMEYDARQPARAPSGTFVHSIVQPDYCDR
jgi:hypothetical protein